MRSPSSSHIARLPLRRTFRASTSSLVGSRSPSTGAVPQTGCGRYSFSSSGSSGSSSRAQSCRLGEYPGLDADRPFGVGRDGRARNAAVAEPGRQQETRLRSSQERSPATTGRTVAGRRRTPARARADPARVRQPSAPVTPCSCSQDSSAAAAGLLAAITTQYRPPTSSMERRRTVPTTGSVRKPPVLRRHPSSSSSAWSPTAPRRRRACLATSPARWRRPGLKAKG